jgi:hypothetical protein
MKISLHRSLLLAIAASLGIEAVAISAEPAAGDKIRAATPVKKEARGLLASRIAAMAEPVQEQLEQPVAQEPAADTFVPATFQNASWSDFSNETLATTSSNTLSSSCGEGNCSSCDCCIDPMWCHRASVFADVLYLRPGNIDYIYAVEQTGPLPTDSPTGPTGRVGFDADLGFRVGFSIPMSDCSSIVASYTWFETDTQDRITAIAPNVLVFQPGDPSIPNVGTTSIESSANYYIRFQQFDVDYRALLYGTCDSAVNYFAGVRYANLNQNFRAQQDIGVPFGLATVNTEIDFDGFGIGFGLDGIRRSEYSGLLVYGKASSSFVGGEFKADYREVSQFGPNSIIANSLVDFRVMTILQTELGVGWQSCCGRIRATAGYQVAGWFNALTTGTYILGVQNREFSELFEAISFDGFVGRLEYRF